MKTLLLIALLNTADSTWCPVYEHIFQCTYRVGPWRKKEGGMYVRTRYCNFHKVKQKQYAKRN